MSHQMGTDQSSASNSRAFFLSRSMIESSQHPELFNTLKALVRAIFPSAPSYCLVGSVVALGACGKVRATQDIDCLIFLNDETRAHLLAALATQGFTVDGRSWMQSVLLAAQTRLSIRTISGLVMD